MSMHERARWGFAEGLPTRCRTLPKGLAENGQRGESRRQSIHPKRGTPMDFTMSDRQREWLGRVQSFMKNHVRPAVPIYRKQDEEGPRWKVIPIVGELKKKAG